MTYHGLEDEYPSILALLMYVCMHACMDVCIDRFYIKTPDPPRAPSAPRHNKDLPGRPESAEVDRGLALVTAWDRGIRAEVDLRRIW